MEDLMMLKILSLTISILSLVLSLLALAVVLRSWRKQSNVDRQHRQELQLLKTIEASPSFVPGSFSGPSRTF